ncbi:phosphoribosylaminoimidazolesuccinocarboxamide synthase [Virgisporangium aurantiacum]|uniref:phosphoribosylaminoimidazolesuccinocarboxamide synthase n=1 Tax=Virgisporangium aurantiacum TaxID=175570 RepID=A0A8J3Z2G4_9ACTN|nr:phosphoribosylaminoimidazolesuccinocarboxamide synthase [Virgisporangium aurantiacum]GIJ56206.1 hypothetical protein Vau01_037220 [Virgisporangium aurantiacum]
MPSQSELRGRSMLVRRLDMIEIECIARSYLAGSGVIQYRSTGSVCGISLPPGLAEGSRLPTPIFTPKKKITTGPSEPVTYAEMETTISPDFAMKLKGLTLAVLERARRICEPRGILVADTKLEFGLAQDGQLVLADELLTPDSSRFWNVENWNPGGKQASFGKQPLLDWLVAVDWDMTYPRSGDPRRIS